MKTALRFEFGASAIVKKTMSIVSFRGGAGGGYGSVDTRRRLASASAERVDLLDRFVGQIDGLPDISVQIVEEGLRIDNARDSVGDGLPTDGFSDDQAHFAGISYGRQQ